MRDYHKKEEDLGAILDGFGKAFPELKIESTQTGYLYRDAGKQSQIDILLGQPTSESGPKIKILNRYDPIEKTDNTIKAVLSSFLSGEEIDQGYTPVDKAKNKDVGSRFTVQYD